MIRQAFAGAVRSIGPREFNFTAVTAKRGRDGHVLVPAGVDLTQYKRNPVVLFQHDPGKPVARCTGISLVDGEVRGSALFPDAGICSLCDEVCALVKSHVINAISIGFEILQAEPLDPKQGRAAGLRINSSECLELSLVSVPSDTGALITARAAGADLMNKRNYQQSLDELREDLEDAQEHHRAVGRALRRGETSEAARHHHRLGQSLASAQRNLGMSKDQLNSSLSQTSKGTTFGTSNGHGPPSLEALDRPRAAVPGWHQRQLEVAGLALGPPRPIGGAAGVAAFRSYEDACRRLHIEAAARADAFRRDPGRAERQIEAERLRRPY